MRLTKAQKAARQFEKAIHKYLEQGYTEREAVDKAYKEFPVMKIMQNEIQGNLASTMIKASVGTITLNEARRATRMAWAKDDLTLSERTTKGGKMVQTMTAKAIQDAIKQGKSLKKLSLDIFNGYTVGGVIPTQDIPKCIAELTIIAKLKKDTGSKLYRQALSKVRNHLKRVNKPGMKAAYKQLVKAIDSLDEAKIHKAIHVAAYEKTRYFAERIARTETSRAWNAGVFRRWAEDTDCVAFQWKLSTAHPVTDICDLYAHANLYGMGPGIFPKDKVPVLPAHPNCMCRLRPVMTGSDLLQTEHAEDMVNKGGADYLKKSSAETRKKILGVKGAESFEMGKVVDWRGIAHGFTDEHMTTRFKVRHKVQSVYGLYMSSAAPGGGDILYDVNYRPNKHRDEIKVAGILNSVLGGDITLLEEVNTPGTKRPDYVWRGKMWELKTVSSEKAADRAIRKGVKQIAKNPGGIILNFGENTFSTKQCKNVIIDRLKRSEIKTTIDIIVLKQDKILNIFRYKKQKR
nr:MAG TPA_asm: CDI toxin-like protein [Caudoviricetes sp.]